MLDMNSTQSEMANQVRSGQGFIAALDQSGGSTPKALALYGVSDDTYSTADEMYDLIHDMRARIIQAPDFNGDKVVGAILFEMTMNRQVNGKPTAQALWDDNGIVPFLKIDKGLDGANNDVKLMNPMPHLSDLLPRARTNGIFGTKMRSVIDGANRDGIAAVVAQQFDFGREVLSHGLVPIIEPEITISIHDKAEAEDILRDELLNALDAMDDEVMLKLTLPETAGHYQALVDHPKAMKVVALSGGYDRTEANTRLKNNSGIIASFSRALTQGLQADQSDAQFNATLAETIQDIHAASIT